MLQYSMLITDYTLFYGFLFECNKYQLSKFPENSLWSVQQDT